MKKQIDQVAEFHRSFKIPMEENPCIPSPERCELRFNLLQEELNEFKEAYLAGDLVEVADALVDLQYILCGSVLEFGLQDKFVALFDEVQRSNMSKLDDNGEPIYREDGKVLKSKNWSPPSLQPILEAELETTWPSPLSQRGACGLFGWVCFWQ